ncbi:ATP-binding protein [Streptomyces sp. NPDC001205]
MNCTASAAVEAPAPLIIEGHSPAGVPRTRDVARAFARGLEPALEAERAENVALLVSELATNALRHGGGQYTMDLGATAEAVHVIVSDPSSSLPGARPPDLHRGSGGFGWHLIRHLTSDVTITPGPGDGKTIQARIPRCPTERGNTATAVRTTALR